MGTKGLNVVAALVLSVTVSPAFAATTWKGAAGGDWFVPDNWTPTGVPAAGADVVIGAGKSVVLSNETARLKSLDLTGTLTFTNWNTAVWATNVTIQANGNMTCPAGGFRDTEMSNRVSVVCVSNLEIKVNGKIDVSGCGY